MQKNIPIAKRKYPFALKRASLSLFLAIGNTELFLKRKITFGVRYINSLKCNNRKIIFFFLLNFLFFGFPIAYSAQEIVTPASPAPKEADNTNSSLTQSEIRNLKKWEVGGLGATGLISAKINYNLTSRFSIGYSHLHYKEVDEKFRVNFAYSNAKLSYVEANYKHEIGRIHLRYYLFEKIPFYITTGFGRYFNGYLKRSYDLGNLDSNGNFYPHPVIKDINYSPHNFLFLGLGFQWVFQNGFFLGMEAFRVNVYNLHAKTTYTILDPNYSSTSLALSLLNSEKDKIKGNFLTGDLWFGYAFSF
ncbi:MAG: hypothetical protein KBA66_05705 [Leptospiraceae bacterium]|nr:hypothetical protein [Leptospiraceae bacterium]